MRGPDGGAGANLESTGESPGIPSGHHEPPGSVGAEPPAARVSTRPGLLRRLVSALLVFVVACAVATPVVAYQVHRFPVISPIDEVTYIDYLSKVHAHHYIVGEGETDGAAADHAARCYGIGNAGIDSTGYSVRPNAAACAGAPHALLGYRDTADIDPPTYYVLTDLGARALLGIGVTHDLVTAGRLVGIVWAGLGLSLLFGLALMLGARRSAAAVIGLATLVTSYFWTNWTHVTPHAADLAVGATVTIAVLQWLRGRAPAVVLLAAGLVPVLFKASDVTVVAFAVLLCLVAAGRTRLGPVAPGRLQEIRRLLLGAGLILVGLAVGTAGWLLVRNHYALTRVPSFPQFDVTSFRASYLFDQVGDFLTVAHTGVAAVLTFWTFGSVVRFASERTGQMTSDREPPGVAERQVLAIALIPVLVLGACLYVLSNYVLLHQYVGIPNRYGLTVLPLVLALGAVALRSRWAQVAGAAIVVLLTVETFHPGL